MANQRIDGRLLYARFASAWGKRFVENHPTDEFVQIWCIDWESGLKGIDSNVIMRALDKCRLTMDWPPVLSEFLRMCDQQSGLPGIDEAYQLAFAHNFSNPLVETAFKQIISWDWTHDSERDLRKKFAAAWKKTVEEHQTARMLGHGEAPHGLEEGVKRKGNTGESHERRNLAGHAMDFLPKGYGNSPDNDD